MVNLKIVALGYYLPVVGTLLLAEFTLLDDDLTIGEMLVCSCAVSFVAGFAAGIRPDGFTASAVAKSALTTAIAGLCLAAVMAYFVLSNPPLAWITVGATGLISLGGLRTIDKIQKLTTEEVIDRVRKKR
jgi:hypothetical protein